MTFQIRETEVFLRTKSIKPIIIVDMLSFFFFADIIILL